MTIVWNTSTCRQRHGQAAIHLEESPCPREGKQLLCDAPRHIRLHYRGRGHRRVSPGCDIVAQVQGARAGEGRIPLWQPQHLLHGELPHWPQQYCAGLFVSGLRLHRWRHQRPGKGAGRWYLHQRRLLQPCKLKVRNALLCCISYQCIHSVHHNERILQEKKSFYCGGHT